jgi:hydrogenase maturation factor
MHLLTGEVVELGATDELRTAIVRVGPALKPVSLALLPSAKPGDYVLIEGGVAIAPVEPASP